MAVDSQAYSDANGEAIRYSSAFVPLIRMAILAGFTMTLVVGGRADAATATWTSASSRCSST